MPSTTPPPRALLVGWKPVAIEALRAEGCSVVCAVSATDAERARSGTDAGIVVADQAGDVESVLFALGRAGLSPGGFDLVTSGQEYSLVAAAAIGAIGGVRSLPVAVAIALRDKFVQKERVRAAGVATARCEAFDDPSGVEQAALRVGGFPVVVKPLAGAGARNTARLASPEAARAWAASAAVGPWLVEEFVPGAELHLDGVVRDGRIRLLGASRYLRNVIDVHSGALVGSVSLTAAEQPELYARAHALVERVLAALGHADGVFHIEVFEQPDGSLVFGECGGRVGGGRIDEVTRRAFGGDLHRHWAAATLGAPAPEVARTAGGSFGWAFLTAPAGLVRSVPSPDELRTRPGVVDATVKLLPGELSRPAVKSFDRAGDVVVTGADSAEVAARLTACAEWFASAVTVAADAGPAA
ncbi:ATP-grasp domain-containing protein [Kitasatospora sp. A2-31]|uniref:ATP-grasp domain-containing protein n=1 Tax=Kitasatospora sp. A2-31 TaxID=2916414 RepID=UPI001EEBA742|nr:ATP-grasp domain-containing protein [Kitasatospora sp. A2-31]MCG6495821.1 ATP-grasp domain-containing protein [Kitasatospora sp. A2-31]